MLDDAAKIAIPASHTQFSSLENPKFGLSVEISFHDFSHILCCTVLYNFCPCQAQLYIFHTLGTSSPRAFFPSLCSCTVLVVTSLFSRL